MVVNHKSTHKSLIDTSTSTLDGKSKSITLSKSYDLREILDESKGFLKDDSLTFVAYVLVDKQEDDNDGA